MSNTPQKVRIHSLDALRGITLLGILLVHASGMFGFGRPDFDTETGYGIRKVLSLALDNRCAPVFGMLFGVSFYLILKNPNYSGLKFMWRCILLMAIGVFNKIFYTFDALMWYGIFGICLLAFRNTPPRILPFIFLILMTLSAILRSYGIGDAFFPADGSLQPRYIPGTSLSAIMSYPVTEAVKDYLRIVLNGGIFGALAYFVLGYYFGKSGIIENLDRYVTAKTVIALCSAYAISILAYYITHLPFIMTMIYVSGALAMATTFVWIYHMKPSLFSFLEPYGKLGLTNYSFQSYIGVILVATFAVPHKVSFEYVILCILAIYAMQCVFSSVWLKHFNYGPFEWLWRCLTSMKFVTPLKANS